jgi:hypothetical protein
MMTGKNFIMNMRTLTVLLHFQGLLLMRIIHKQFLRWEIYMQV